MVRIAAIAEAENIVRSALVGRSSALSTLQEVCARALDFQAPQLVTIVGNQGTGKTRLINEMIVQLRSADRTVRIHHGTAERDATGTPKRFAAMTSLLRDRFGLAATVRADKDASTPPVRNAVRGHATGPVSPQEAGRDSAATSDVSALVDAASAGRFAREVNAVAPDQATEMLYFIGGYLGLEFPATPFLRVATENPRHRTDLARIALRRFIELDAARSPLVFVLDDLQWADDDTLALLDDITANLSGAPVVVVVAARPEMLVRSVQWGEGASNHTRIDLRNLEGDDAEQMFKNLLARCEHVPDDTVQFAIEMTGGNPAVLEQLVRRFLGNGTIDNRNGVWRLDPKRASATELPISIEEAIEARIAALEPEERELLERAAVFGNVFWLSAVVAMTRLERPPAPTDAAPLDIEWGDGEDVRRRVSDVISILAERDYLLLLDAQDSSVAGDIEVVFKHNLEREQVARSIEPGRLARYYIAAARWLEAKLPTLRDEQLEFLATLYERGGDMERAARCYLQGGDRARARYSPEEALSLYEKGLAMIGQTDAPERLDALHNLGDVLEQSGKTQEASSYFIEMLHVAWRYDNLNKAGAAYARLARVQRRLGKYDLALKHLRRAHQLFERSDDDRGIASTLDDIGRVHWLRGEYVQALELHRQSLAIRRTVGDRRSIALSLANIGRVHHDSGNFKAAIAQFREALDLRRDANDLVGIVQSLCDLAGVHGDDGNHEVAMDLLTEAGALAKETGDKPALAEVLSRTGEVKGVMGRGVEATKDLMEAKALALGLHDRVALTVTHLRLAQLYLTLGDLESADVEAHAAVAVSQSVGLRAHIGCGFRIKAEVTVAMGKELDAQADFERAIEILAAVKNDVEVARAYQGLAAIRDRAGFTDEAHSLRRRASDIFARLRGAANVD